MDIKMNGTSGVTLKTAGKYCTEDIVVTPNFEIGITPTGSIEITENGTYDVTDKASAVVNVAGSGGSSDIIEVEALPTENIDASKIYVVNKVSDINVYFCSGSGYYTLAEAVGSGLGFTPTIYYEVVSEFPASPNATNLQTFNPIYCYIYNGIPYVYGNAGFGDMWLTISALFASMGTTIEDKGRTADINRETEVGLYVYYMDKQVGIPTNQYNGYFLWENDSWEEKYPKNLFMQRIKRSLTTVTAKDLEGATAIPSYAFYDCNSLFSVEIPDSVTWLGIGAFGGCSLTSIKIPNSVTEIGADCFRECKFTSVVIPNSVTYIGASAFYSCDLLTSVVIGSGVISINSQAFWRCSSLTSVVIPNSVTYIGSQAFRDCTSLSSIEIPNSVATITDEVFYNCSKLTSITYNGTKAQWKAITFYTDWDLDTGDYVITCTDGTIAKDGTET